ncbi:MAG: hypothetical protein LBQ87_09605 [Candidatus Fibromonas sp.]|jgi:flagellar basal body-associated protein FliL|nr:hypothetical protein [Candidatus Fibromonas sp.]
MTGQNEIPSWSVRRQKAYKISRIIWIAQIVLALLASVGIGVWVFALR